MGFTLKERCSCQECHKLMNFISIIASLHELKFSFSNLSAFLYFFSLHSTLIR